jgi:hypothetical protein
LSDCFLYAVDADAQQYVVCSFIHA